MLLVSAHRKQIRVLLNCVFNCPRSLRSFKEREFYSHDTYTSRLRVCEYAQVHTQQLYLYTHICSRTRDPLPHLVSARNKRLITLYRIVLRCNNVCTLDECIPRRFTPQPRFELSNLRQCVKSPADWKHSHFVPCVCQMQQSRVLNIRGVITAAHYKTSMFSQLDVENRTTQFK